MGAGSVEDTPTNISRIPPGKTLLSFFIISYATSGTIYDWKTICTLELLGISVLVHRGHLDLCFSSPWNQLSKTSTCRIWESVVLKLPVKNPLSIQQRSEQSQRPLTRRRCWSRRHTPRILCSSGTGSPWSSASSQSASPGRPGSDSPAPRGRCRPARRRRWSRPRCSSSTQPWSWLFPAGRPPSLRSRLIPHGFGLSEGTAPACRHLRRPHPSDC